MAMAVIQFTPGVADTDDRLFEIFIAQPHPFAESSPDEGAESTIPIGCEPPSNSFRCHRVAPFLPVSPASDGVLAMAHEHGRAFQ
jgi:hypothetical protein